ncbi:MAG TPA: DAK2 domain-containing protein [Miltoncostaeaceae bacterium]|nr:DAK2 domain-containing protein [Miltoncostaeaceae bacterium]
MTRPAGPAVSEERLAEAVGRARAALAARADEVDLLNVFPVADGDTGVNMLRTATAVDEAARSTTGLPRAARCDALARAALMGAQGNSGMILSQLVRGAAEALAHGDIDGPAVARALRGASDAADAAVRHPVEGTMLSVARAMAGAAEAAASPDRDAVLAAAVAAGAEAVAATTGQMAVLAEAGVVDSGALGVLILVEGLADALAGRAPRAAPAVAPSRPATAAHPPSRYRFCTTFLVEGAHVDLARLEDALEAVGDSLLVMGDSRRAKVHVHTDVPERAAEVAARWGLVEGLKADDMRRQEAERTARLAAVVEPGGLVAVAEGAGVRDLLAGLGAAAVAPGEPLGEAGVVLALAPGPDAPGARVVAVPSLPAMLAAALAWDPGDDPDAAAAGMRTAAGEVTAIEVAVADRDALAAALAPALEGGGLVTVLIGEGAGVSPDEVEAWVRGLVPPGVEVEAHFGGQAAPALAVGVE